MAGKHRAPRPPPVVHSLITTVVVVATAVVMMFTGRPEFTVASSADLTISSVPTTTTTTTAPPSTTTAVPTTTTTITTEAPPPPPPPPPPVVTTTEAPPPPVFTPGQSGQGWQAMWDVISSQFPDATLSSGYRCTDTGYHCKGLAIDIAYPMDAWGMGRMLEVNYWIARNYPNSTELIHTPGINLWHGQSFSYDASTQDGHYDHVHWAFAGSV